ncbi:hypothetical protein BDR26DRAFT_1011403 [Obelidium mucronatum]|nr:hypothetical protein BDR26DRAFT_1011403 [Obelidium mucronatum]
MLQVESLALLRARNSLNLQGALELGAELLVGCGGISRKIFGVGLQLAALASSKTWLDEVGKIRKNSVVYKDIFRAQNALYHSYSKDKHAVTEPQLLNSQK